MTIYPNTMKSVSVCPYFNIRDSRPSGQLQIGKCFTEDPMNCLPSNLLDEQLARISENRYSVNYTCCYRVNCVFLHIETEPFDDVADDIIRGRDQDEHCSHAPNVLNVIGKM